MGYFALAINVITFDENIDGKMRIALDGVSHRVPNLAVYLIGQLGKNDTHKHKIEGKTILDFAMAAIGKAHDAAGGRVVRVDCREIPKVYDFYVANGFTLLQKFTSSGMGVELNLLVKSIK